MKRLKHTLFTGPNLHSTRALVRLDVDGEGSAPLSKEELATRLHHIWPEERSWPVLADCLTRLAEDEGCLHWAQAIGFIGVFGQLMAPDPGLLYWHRHLDEDAEGNETDKFAIFIEARLPLTGEASAKFALEVTHSLFQQTALEEGENLRLQLRRYLALMARRRRGKEYNNITRLLVNTALARGVPVSQYFSDSSTAVMGHGCRRRRMKECFGDSTSVIANSIARDKAFTAHLLSNIGVPVPKQRQVRSRAELDKAIEDIGFPLVIKGRTGSKGDSVTANIRSREEVHAAVKKVRDAGQEVLVERHIDGEDYRLTVIDGKLVAAARRVPAHVIGDGKQSIADLIAEENERRTNWDSPYVSWIQLLVLDDDMHAVLARQNLTPESVPPEGERIALRTAGNFSLGGLSEDVTDELHPTVVAAMERAARTLGLDMAGVDLLSPDITKPIDTVRCAVNEVNNFPSPRAHYITRTPPRDVAGAVIDYLFPAEHRGRIPFVALLSQQTAAIAALLRQVFDTTGLTAGSASRDGLYLGQEKFCDARDLGPRDTATILQDPAVEAAILEIWPPQLVRQGLAWDACDTVVIDGKPLNDERDNRRLEDLLASLARKALVLNASSTGCRELARRLRKHATQISIIWVAADGEVADREAWISQGDLVVAWQSDTRCASVRTGQASAASDESASFDLSATSAQGIAPEASLFAIGAALSLEIEPAIIQTARQQSVPNGQALRQAG